MSDTEREKLLGHVLATQAAVRALIKLHPDMNAAALAVQRGIEKVIADGLPIALPDALIDGIAAAKKRILPGAGDYAERRGD